jgi:hypothetical protein
VHTSSIEVGWSIIIVVEISLTNIYACAILSSLVAVAVVVKSCRGDGE